MKILSIIPARYASSRFPGKPLALIGGKSMIHRVWEQARRCEALNRVVVATDDERIRNHVLAFGGAVLMTSPDHRSGTERCCEAYDLLGGKGFDVIINIQGDEPFIHPGQIAELAGLFNRNEVTIGTLVRAIRTNQELHDPNHVKVVFDKNGKAIMFSRQVLPYMRNIPQGEWLRAGTFYRHVGIYGYRPDVLKKITALPSSVLEQAEALEQLRWIENGYAIHVIETFHDSISIDTPADLLKITNIEPL
jgi:3-deoxy-manno-octulosonate cytidylyltransferase (CMP-KDO synthetase)